MQAGIIKNSVVFEQMQQSSSSLTRLLGLPSGLHTVMPSRVLAVPSTLLQGPSPASSKRVLVLATYPS